MHAQGGMQRRLASMSRLERHQHLLGNRGFETDMDAVRRAHQFLWDDETNERSQWRGWGDAPPSSAAQQLTWEQRLARKYYASLHREYALADMSRYREGAIGLRWRTERELFDGKGQFTCGNKACTDDQQLESFELNFAYEEVRRLPDSGARAATHRWSLLPHIGGLYRVSLIAAARRPQECSRKAARVPQLPRQVALPQTQGCEARAPPRAQAQAQRRAPRPPP